MSFNWIIFSYLGFQRVLRVDGFCSRMKDQRLFPVICVVCKDRDDSAMLRPNDVMLLRPKVKGTSHTWQCSKASRVMSCIVMRNDGTQDQTLVFWIICKDTIYLLLKKNFERLFWSDALCFVQVNLKCWGIHLTFKLHCLKMCTSQFLWVSIFALCFLYLYPIH